MIDVAQKLFELTEQLKQKTALDEWDEVEKIQTQRLELLTEISNGQLESISEQTASKVRELLEDARKVEQECEALAAEHRTQLTKEHGKLSKGKAMQRAYGQ